MANFFGHTPTPFLFCKGVPPLRGRDASPKRKQPASLWGQANRLRTTTKGANNRVRVIYANVRRYARWFVRVWGVGVCGGILWGVRVAPQKKEARPWYLVNRKKGVPPLNICNKSFRHTKENPLESGFAYLAARRGRRAGRPRARLRHAHLPATAVAAKLSASLDPSNVAGATKPKVITEA